jgi:hypothetical protein
LKGYGFIGCKGFFHCFYLLALFGFWSLDWNWKPHEVGSPVEDGGCSLQYQAQASGVSFNGTEVLVCESTFDSDVG